MNFPESTFVGFDSVRHLPDAQQNHPTMEPLDSGKIMHVLPRTIDEKARVGALWPSWPISSRH